MDIAAFKEKTAETVITPMIEYQQEIEDEGYTRAHIDRCEALIHAYLEALDELEDPTDEAIMAQVEILVLALNDLNEETDYAMIETVEREAIWEVTQEAAVAAGLREIPDDVTEQWRDW